MIRIRGLFLETSYGTFQHPDGHKVCYFSCIHFGRSSYFRELQQIISIWEGVIFEERLTGDSRFSELIPKEKAGIQLEWKKFHKLQRMKSQRRILKYPISRTVSTDISWPEAVRLYDTVSIRLPFSARYLKQVMRALENNPKEAYIALWYTFMVCLKAWCDLPEGASYTEEMVAQENKFRHIREHIASLSQPTPHLWRLYRIFEHIYLHEPTTNFMPERDTAVLRGIDLERCGQKRDILLVYGGGHYRGVTKGLYDRGYTKAEEVWMRVCDFPPISLKKFTEALITISKSV